MASGGAGGVYKLRGRVYKLSGFSGEGPDTQTDRQTDTIIKGLGVGLLWRLVEQGGVYKLRGRVYKLSGLSGEGPDRHTDTIIKGLGVGLLWRLVERVEFINSGAEFINSAASAGRDRTHRQTDRRTP